MLAEPHHFGSDDHSTGPDRYSGPVNYIELNGGYIGTALLLLAMLAPALARNRGRAFWFCWCGFLATVMVSADVPPFSHALGAIPPFDLIVNRRLLGVGALLAAVAAAYAFDGIAQLSRAQLLHAARASATWVVAIAGCVFTYDAESVPPRVHGEAFPELLPRPLGSPALHLTSPPHRGLVYGQTLRAEGFLLSTEGYGEVKLRVRSRVGEAPVVSTTARIERDTPRPTHEILRQYPNADRSGFLAELDLAGFPGGDADLEVILPQPDGTEAVLHRRWFRIVRTGPFDRLWWTLPATLLAMGLLLAGPRRTHRTLGSLILLATVLADLGLYAHRHIPQIDPAHHFPEFPELAALSSGSGRIASPPDLLGFNTHMAYGLASIAGKDVIESDAYRRIVDAVRTGVSSPLERSLGLSLDHPLFPLLGIDRLFVPASVAVAEEEAEVVERTEAFQVLRPRRPPIRARWYDQVVRMGTEESATAALERLGGDVAEVLVLGPEQDDGHGERQVQDSPGRASADALNRSSEEDRVRWILDEPDVLELEIQSGEDGWLLITDVHSPHFRAEVDGEPAAVEPAFGALLAIQVPAADGSTAIRRVRIEYRPLPWLLGLVLAGLGALLLVGVVTFARRSS